MSDDKDKQPDTVIEVVPVTRAELQVGQMMGRALAEYVACCQELASDLQDTKYSDDAEARLDFVRGAVAASMRFLQTVAPSSDAHIPFIELLTELQSIEEGRGSRILKSPKTMKGPTPSQALLDLQVYVVASIDALHKGEAKLKLPQAARVVAECIDKAKVSLPGNSQTPTRQQLLQWRTQMFSRPGNSSPKEKCRVITRQMLDTPADGGQKAGILRALEKSLTDIFSAAHTSRAK